MTIDKVAELAYVSRSVVSRVLNGHPNVSDEARRRVEKVIEEHDYRPSSVARSLATDRSFEISVLTPRRGDESLATGYWSLLYSGIFERCLERGYFVSLSMIALGMEDGVNDRIRDKRFDGHIFITQEVTDLIEDSALENQGAPVVLVGRDPEWESVPSLDIDNTAGGYKAGRHLCELGHEAMGLLLGTAQLEETGERRRGFEQALVEHGRALVDERVAYTDYSPRSGYDAVRAWIEDDRMPSALFCAGDTIAMGVLRALDEANYHVPGDVAVVGFDGLPASQYTNPPLTTVRQPVYEKGTRAADTLLDQVESETSASGHVTLEPELVVRQSCGARVT